MIKMIKSINHKSKRSEDPDRSVRRGTSVKK